MPRGELTISLSVHYADDPKLAGLAEWPDDACAARDLYLQMICYCKINMTDGMVPRALLAKLGYPSAPADTARRAVMLTEVGSIQQTADGWYVPAFLKRNKSREEVTGTGEIASVAGSRGNHLRWHVRRNTVDPTCSFCWGLDGEESPESVGAPRPSGNPMKAIGSPDRTAPDSASTQEVSDSPWSGIGSSGVIGSPDRVPIGVGVADLDLDLDLDTGPDRPDRAPSSRKRDALWDSVINACGIEQNEITKSMRGSINAALRDLREVGATAPEVGVRARRYRRRWPNVSLTPTALAKQWATLTADTEPTSREEPRIKPRRGNTLAAAR